MAQNEAPIASDGNHSLRHEISFLATACGLLAAVGYMSANIFLRSLTHLDPSWVTCVKAVPTVIAFGPLVIRRLLRHERLFESSADLTRTILVAIISQITGNIFFQWSLGVVGLAISVPLTLGALIASGALLGRWILKDAITVRMAIASCILIFAFCILSVGAPAANAAMASLDSRIPLTSIWITMGVAAACISGISYTLLNISIRFSSNRGTPQSSLLFTVGVVGVLFLGGITFARHGFSPLQETSSADWIRLFGAGICNVTAFWALTKALHLASVVFVNALNASQTAMAAIAGVIIFNEPLTAAMIIGTGLTVVGLLLMTRNVSPANNRLKQPPVEPNEADSTNPEAAS
ncbi:MAG: DMT family transporter [Planctomycetaceae bacterium]|nr:DMT family transporter [Planctomycetaceae bacterium]